MHPKLELEVKYPSSAKRTHFKVKYPKLELEEDLFINYLED